MENYQSHCPACNATYRWTGYKTGIGKTPEQLEQMHLEQTVCRECGSPRLKTDVVDSPAASFVAALLTGATERKTG